jgi:hypothetical protein
VQLHLLTPEPGTKLMREFADALAYDGHISDFNFPTLESDDSEIMEQNPEVFMNHHYYFCVLPRPRHVFVTSLFKVLYALGFPLLTYLLNYYDGKLSRLMASMYEWGVQAGHNHPDESFVLGYIENRWGREHHLTSLVRYMTTAHQLLNSDVQTIAFPSISRGEKKTKLRRGHKYNLSSQTVILRDIHNCPELLKLIEAGRPTRDSKFQGELSTARGDYLLFLENSHDKTVRNFELNEPAIGLFEFLTVPRTYQECTIKFPDHQSDSQSLKAFLEELLQIGILSGTRDGEGRGKTTGSLGMPQGTKLEATVRTQ